MGEEGKQQSVRDRQVHRVKPAEPTSAEGRADENGQQNRTSALSGLFREHNRTLVRFINARLRNEQEANEIAQEAYVKMLQLDRCPGTASFMRHYLFRIAENLAVDRIRQRYARSRLDQLTSIDDLFQEALAERTVLADQELALLTEAVAELPEKYGEAFRLVKLEDHSFPQVAALMRLSERMVRKYVTRALVYIRLRREGNSARDAWSKVQS
jgi:RNA polymerase sigma factor (sigma-70 family)